MSDRTALREALASKNLLLSLLHPLLGPVQPDTDLHREHDGHEASSYQDRANHNDRPDVMILLLVQNIEEEKTEPRQEKKQATGDKE